MSTDFVIITALEEERDAVLSKLPNIKKLPPSDEDIRVYFKSDLPVTYSDGSTHTYSIVVLCLLNMGRVEAANATSDAIRRWHPRYVILVGIAGGIAENKVQLGDIIISDQIIDYELQKLTPNGDLPRDSVHRADPRLLGAAQNLIGDEWLGLVKEERPEDGKPKRIIGPIATGDKVIAQKDVLIQLMERWPKLIGIEMEAGGAASASFQAESKPGFFMVRGISDLADEDKDSEGVKSWRLYACDIAAAYTIALLQSGPVPPYRKLTEQAASPNASILPYPQNPYFTGRDRILEQIEKSLRSSSISALTQVQAISGLGGIGKTQTAVEYAYRNRENYRNIFVVRASSFDLLVSGYTAMAMVLNLPEANIPNQDLITAVIRWMKSNTNWLLILDNADDLSLVEHFLPDQLGGHILLTSRAQVFDKLGIGGVISLDVMTPEEARDFFIKRVGKRQIDEAELSAAEQLSEELGYLPLALEQAGAYIKTRACRFQDYLISYRNRGLELLEKVEAATGKYPASVATTWSLNFEQVEQESKATADLLRISAFLGPDRIPLELFVLGNEELGPELSPALAEIRNDPVALNELLAPLSRYSLIKQEPDYQRYSVHLLVQAVLKDDMDSEMKRLWVERTVRAMWRAFPSIEFSDWSRCERLVSHAELCAKLIRDWNLDFQEAAFLLSKIGGYLSKQARFYDAYLIDNQALDIWEKNEGPDGVNIATGLSNLALVCYEQGKYADAESLFLRSLDIRKRTLGDKHLDVANSLNNLAGLYYEQGKYSEAEEMHKEALSIWEKAKGPESTIVAISLNNLGLVYTNQGKYQEAQESYERSLSILRKAVSANHPNLAQILNNLGYIHYLRGNYRNAESLLAEAYEIRVNAFGNVHLAVAETLNNLGLLFHTQGIEDEAEQIYTDSLNIHEKIFGSDHPKVALSLNNLAEVYTTKRMYFKAEPLYRRSLKIREEFFGMEHPSIVDTLNNLGSLLVKKRQYKEAESLLVRALQTAEKLLGQTHPDLAYTLNNLGMLYFLMRRYNLAEPLLDRAFAIRQKALGAEHPDVIKHKKSYEKIKRIIRGNSSSGKNS